MNIPIDLSMTSNVMTEPRANSKKRKFHKTGNPNELDLIIAEPKKERDTNELYLFSSEVLSLKQIIPSAKHNLHTVVVIGQLGINSLNGISEVINLRELWIVECLIKDISDLGKCKKLCKLYLYSNNISQIPNMSQNPELKLLSLSGNKVSQLENFHSMPKLEELYIANNRIARIGNAFRQNSYLSVINLAGNYLYELKDIQNLSSLRNLRDIVLADPMYGECPLVSLCNYRYFVINCLSELMELDYCPITNEERSYVTGFFKYPNFTHIQDLICNTKKPAKISQTSFLRLFIKFWSMMHDLICRSKMMFYNMLCNKYLNQFTKSLNDRFEEKRRQIGEYRKEIYLAKLEQLRILASNNVGVRSRELLSHEILQQIYRRIDANDASEKQWIKNSGINLQILQRKLSLKVQHCGNMNFVEYMPDAGNKLVRICQDICNDSLCRTIKEDLGITSVRVHRVTKVINNEADAFRSSKYFNETTNHDYPGSDSIFKFLTGPVGVVELSKWPFQIFEQAFFDATEIIMSDCIAAADVDWVQRISLKQKSSPTSLCLYNEHRLAILVQIPISMPTKRVERTDNYHAMHSNYDKDTCQSFSIVKPERVKPVFAVEYEYVFQKRSEKDVSNKRPCIKLDPSNLLNVWPRINLENLGHCLNLTELDVRKLQVIDLSGQGISAIDLTIPFPNLRELNLSYNKLTALPDATILQYVRKLDVSFNDIRSFEPAACLPMLENLNVAWNLAMKFFAILQTLEICTPNLNTLNLKSNPFTDITDVESMSLLARNALPSLKCFHEINIENFVHSRPFNRSSWIIDIFETVDAAELKMTKNSTASVISETNKSLTSPLSIVGRELTNARYVNLSDNYLSRVEFITEFHQIRELYLANNLLVKILLKKPVNQLTRLSLSGNFVMTIDGLTQENLPLLNYLDLCNNLITSLIAMGTFNSLAQFYCSHNKISKLQEISNLKNWYELKIIDLSNNPIDPISLCNKFIIFHIPKIEYVGGECVTASDIFEANHTFGGSLDKDRVMNMCNLGDLTCLKQLSVVNCAIKKVDLAANLLPHLESLDLSQNQITTLWGLHTLRNLRALCLTNNQVETSVPIYRKDFVLTECLFPSLNTLFLDYNGIRTLVDLNFENMPSLKYLYLQHNELQDVNGLQKCANLETLVLDHNKIQMITEEDFHKENNIKTLFLENNKIKFLSFARHLLKITKLFLSNNKVADKEQLKSLATLEHLKEITILGNPLCKRTNHYKYAMRALVTLTRIDGHSVIIKEYLDTQ